MLIFELCTLLDHADENKHLVTYWIAYHGAGFFCTEIRIIQNNRWKTWQKDCFWIPLHYLIYSAIFKTGRETGIGQAQQITLVCLQLIKKASRKLVGAIWGEFCHLLWNAVDFNIFSPGGFFGVTHRAVNGIYWGAKGSNQKRTNITTCNLRPVILI